MAGDGRRRRQLPCQLFLFILLYPLTSLGDGTRQDTVRQIFEKNDYDQHVAPTYYEDVPTNVTVQLFITNIHNIRETQMEFSVDMFFRQSWQDRRLQHNSTRDILELDVATMEKVWTPDTYFSNAKAGRLHEITVPNKMMHVSREGAVLYSLHLSVVLNCSMDLTKYPLDDQFCPVRIESYAYSANVVMFAWHPDGPATVSDNVEAPKFSFFRHVNTSRCDTFHANVGLFSCIEAEIRLHRKIGYFVLEMFVPSSCIVILSWVSFWIDHESVPARISLGLLTVLTMTTQISSFKNVLPHVSYVKAIDVWTAACLLFVFLALLEYAAVNQVATCHTHKEDGSPKAKIGTLLQRLRGIDGIAAARRLDRLSRVIFPVCFLTFNAVFWAYYLITHC